MSVRILASIASDGCALNGVVANTAALKGYIRGTHKLRGCICSGTQQLSGILATAYVMNANAYTGEYEVTPKTTAQELLTRQKFMANDVTVYAIPYYEVGNNSGGSTVYIGGKDELQIE